MNMERIIILLSLTVLVFAYSCNHGSNPETTRDKDINNYDSSEQKFYFSGKIKDTVKYFEDGKDSFTVYIGGNRGNDFRWVVSGLKKVKETLGDESIEIDFPNQINVDSTNVDNFFRLGDVPFSDEYGYYQTGYVISYYTTSCVAGTCHYVFRSCFGKQDGSFIKIVEKSYFLMDKAKCIKLKIKFNCNLYTMDGKYFGKIEDGTITVFSVF